jgi:hypothetical protein
MKKTKLLYLHGFNSSPQSYKARQITQYLAERGRQSLLLCPQIPVVPEEARLFLEHLVEDTLQQYHLNFAGSSLGGYYANYLAEKYSGSAVLVNPAVKPYETLRKYLGENRFYYEDGSWEFTESHIHQLEYMKTDMISSPDRYLVLLQTGDETLDYREAARKYTNTQCIIEKGGNHAFTGFERYIPRIMKFSKILCD